MSSKTWFRCLVTCVVVALCAMPVFAQKAGKTPGSCDKFTANLEKDDFIVREGEAIHFDPVQNYCDGDLPNALYANYKAPYVAAVVPDNPNFEGQVAQGPLPVFKLAPDEAVVLIGLTPPQEAYFSYQIYLAQRWYPDQSEPELLLNSLGDTVNIQTMNTIGPDPFERPMVLIFTPDQEIDARVRAALRRAGYPVSIINTIVVPSATLKLGFDQESDTLLILNRNAIFTEPDDENEYMDHPTFRVFRVTPEDKEPLYPFPTAPLRVRGTGQTEIDLTPTLAVFRQAIVDSWESEGYTAKEFLTSQIANEGYDYTQRHALTLGDTRDSLYLGAGNLPQFGLNDDLKLADGEFLIAYGLNHMATGKATYTNINSYTPEGALALGSVFPAGLEGSAYEYLTPGDPIGELTYALKISRDCGDDEEFCLTLEVPPCAIGKVNLDANSLLGIVFRLYLEPATSVGPSYPEIVYDQIIKFTPNVGP